MNYVAVSAVSKQMLKSLVPPDNLARQLRRADDFINLAVVCARDALDRAPARDLSPEQTGIFIGTAYGPLETNFSSLGSLIEDGEGQISPTLFSHSVFNAAAGYVSRLLGILGPALTVTTYAWPLLTALNQARLFILSGRIERAVVVSAETYSALLEDAYKRSFGKEEVPWQPGAVAWVLDPLRAAAQGVPLLGDIPMNEQPCDSGSLLARRGEIWQGQGLAKGEGTHPMAYAYALTDAVSGSFQHGDDTRKWTVDAPFGRAGVHLKKS